MALFFLKKSLEFGNKYAILSVDVVWRCQMKNKAVELFNAVPKIYNCAQTVAAAAGRNELIEEMRLCGGGKAPENLCGALYAAMLIAGEENGSKIREEFESALGAETCADLKHLQRVPCVRCVEKAAELLEKYGR